MDQSLSMVHRPLSELFRCEYPTHNLRHHQFAIAFKPARSHIGDLSDQRFVLIVTIKHGSPQLAVFAQRSADIVNERRDFGEGEVILELVEFGLGEDSVNGVENIAFEAT